MIKEMTKGMRTDLLTKTAGILLSASIAVTSPTASAQDGGSGDSELPRPVTATYGIGIGGENAYSSYLSPLVYDGTVVTLFGDWRKALPFSPENAVMEFSANVGGAWMHNPPVTTTMLDVDMGFSWGMAWRKRLPRSLQLTAGGDVILDGGCLWLTSNGNNPVSARAFAAVAAKGSISWHTRIGRLPALVADAVRVPLAGLFFSPEYGETYYEIYLGNHSGLVHPAWPGNHFSLTNHLTVSLDFGRTAMQVGYRFEADTSWANHISTRIFRHIFTIGVIPGGLGLKRKAKTNSALF